MLISSHLISELQLTADHVLILGRGRLLADSPMADLVRFDGGDVLVRNAGDTALPSLLSARGATVTPEPHHGFAVTGLTPGDIAAIAAGTRRPAARTDSAPALARGRPMNTILPGRGLLAAEWTKLRSVRSTPLLLAVTATLSLAVLQARSAVRAWDT
ncbi:hypothetical protein [Amycolatopsis sp. CA-126428]|uniref:hypothetical protein n=1 Tax=Amycolatopsis sp. CA-126428 TaxID=2073158 RepID=UPI001E3C0786|nr:hypothetical protein [Amycolatopsis sp. CA-126428]